MEKQPSLNIKTWGGKRRGAGRPNRTKTVNHMIRPKVSMRTPLHLTMRLKKGLPTLRSKALFAEFKRSIKGARDQGLLVIHFSVQSNHIHLFVEAENNDALGRGARSLIGRFAKIIRKHIAKNKLGAKKGSVFSGRYHVHVLKTPREVKNALEYVLLNQAKHRGLIEYIDEYSSGRVFRQWRQLLRKRYGSLIKFNSEFWLDKNEQGLEEILSPPKSWLASTGWARAA